MGRSDDLHRLRSALARVQAEAELLELDEAAAGGIREGLERAFAVLEGMESAVELPLAVVLEDEERLGLLTVRSLSRAGHLAVLATSLEAALQLASAGAALIADLSALEGATLEQTRALRSARPIIVSGAAGESARETARGLRARAYFLKPVDTGRLMEALGESGARRMEAGS